MASKYIPWLDDSQALANAFNYDDFAAGLPSGSQRSQGFQPGTVASAKCVNTALRQANLVAAALMDVVDPNGKTNLQSKRADVATVILNGLRNMFAVKSVQWSEDRSTVTITTSQPFILITAADIGSRYGSQSSVILNTSSNLNCIFTLDAYASGNVSAFYQVVVQETSRTTSNGVITITLTQQMYKITSTTIEEVDNSVTRFQYLSFLMEK